MAKEGGDSRIMSPSPAGAADPPYAVREWGHIQAIAKLNPSIVKKPQGDQLAAHVNRDRLNAAINQGAAHAAAATVEAVMAVTEAPTTDRKSAHRLVVNFL